MTKKLNNLIQLFHERNVVEKIAEAKGDLAVYEEQKNILKKELKVFKAQAEDIIKEKWFAIYDYEVLPKDALQICFICIMTGIDNDNLLTNSIELPTALREIKGDMANLAENIANFIESTGGYVYIYEDEEILKKIFS